MSKFEYIVLDLETSKRPLMHPWQDGAYLSSVGIKTSSGDRYVWFFNPLIGDYDEHIKQIQWFLDNTELVVGHNFLFDAEWLDHIRIDPTVPVFECTMVDEYNIRGQVFKDNDGFLSLNNLARHYGAPLKLDAMAEYWKQGINTAEIPLNIHKEYLFQDLDTTEEVYLKVRDVETSRTLR